MSAMLPSCLVAVLVLVQPHLGVGLVLLSEPQRELFDGPRELEVVLLLVPKEKRHLGSIAGSAGAVINVGRPW